MFFQIFEFRLIFSIRRRCAKGFVCLEERNTKNRQNKSITWCLKVKLYNVREFKFMLRILLQCTVLLLLLLQVRGGECGQKQSRRSSTKHPGSGLFQLLGIVTVPLLLTCLIMRHFIMLLKPSFTLTGTVSTMIESMGTI